MGGGILARTVGGYEAREGQQRMAAAAAATIETGGTLLAEAGTGTGKTLAYLIPAILSRQRVLVSTGTKNLQEQIYFKDIPALREALGVPFTATLMKGRANYLCRHRWEMYRDGVEGNTSAQGRLIDSGDRVLLPIIDEWMTRTQTGDRAELTDLPEELALWKDIAATADTCLGSDCPRYGDCFVTLMRQRAAESDVVIVNHHLLCADAAVRQSEYGEVIPTCPTLVVDEAHQLEDVVTQYFGVSVSNLRVDDLVRDTEHLLAAVTCRPGEDITAHHAGEISVALAHVAESARWFFAGIERSRTSLPGVAESRARYSAEAMAPHFESGSALAATLEVLADRLTVTTRRAPNEVEEAGLGEDGRPLPGVVERSTLMGSRRSRGCRDECVRRGVGGRRSAAAPMRRVAPRPQIADSRGRS